MISLATGELSAALAADLELADAFEALGLHEGFAGCESKSFRHNIAMLHPIETSQALMCTHWIASKIGRQHIHTRCLLDLIDGTHHLFD